MAFIYLVFKNQYLSGVVLRNLEKNIYIYMYIYNLRHHNVKKCLPLEGTASESLTMHAFSVLMALSWWCSHESHGYEDHQHRSAVTFFVIVFSKVVLLIFPTKRPSLLEKIVKHMHEVFVKCNGKVRLMYAVSLASVNRVIVSVWLGSFSSFPWRILGSSIKCLEKCKFQTFPKICSPFSFFLFLFFCDRLKRLLDLGNFSLWKSIQILLVICQ